MVVSTGKFGTPIGFDTHFDGEVNIDRDGTGGLLSLALGRGYRANTYKTCR